MKKFMFRVFSRLTLLSFLIVAGGTAIASAQTKSFTVTFPPVERVWNPEFQGKPELTFEKLEHKLSDSVRLGDKPVLEKLFAEKLMILGVPYTKEQWIRLLVTGKGTFINYEKRDMRIQIHGATVIVTGLQIVDSVTSNGSSSYQYNFMDTLIRTKDGGWQCIAMAGDQVKARN